MNVRTVAANGIEIANESFGDPGGRPLLLIMGLGTQMLAWHVDFCQQLVERGFFVVRFDNRDTGLSTHLNDAPLPNVLASLSGDTSSASYTLDDMADDVAGLLDGLGLDDAHLVGASMGGMIAQTVAIRHPQRVRSLTSIMSTPSWTIGAPTRDAAALLVSPPVTSREEAVELNLLTYRVIGSPDYPHDEGWLTGVARESYERAYDPLGVGRQLVAIQASPDRTEALGGVMAPTLVIHGDRDPLVQVEGGRATARAIPGARMLELTGMGHDLPRELWPTIIDAIVQVAVTADAVPSRL